MKTWPCLHVTVYIPWHSVLGQALRICWSVPCSSHMLHLLELDSLHLVRFTGAGRGSYTKRRKNEIPCCSIDHRSLYVSCFCSPTPLQPTLSWFALGSWPPHLFLATSALLSYLLCPNNILELVTWNRILHCSSSLKFPAWLDFWGDITDHGVCWVM